MEDERLIAADMETYLQGIGYEIIGCVVTGEEAIDSTKVTLPDLVLMDIILKGEMDGIEAAEYIRTQLNIPVVFVVAHADEKTVQRAKKTEPYGYILKPYKEDELKVVIQMALYKHSMEQKLKLSEERLRSLYENTTIGLYRTTPDGRIIMANPALISMLGYNSLEELSQRNLEKEGFEPQYPRNHFKAKIEKNGQILGLESAWKKADGMTLYVRESARAIKNSNGEIEYYEGTVEDITEKKNAEIALQLSHAEWENTFNAISDWVSLVDMRRCILKSNSALGSFIGISPEDVINQDCCELLHRSDGPLDKCPINKMKRSKTRESIELLSPDERSWYQITVDPIFDNKGKLVSAVHIVRDITEKKKIETALEESEQKFRLLYERTPLGYQSLDENGHFLEVSPAWLNMLGYSREDVIGKPFSNFLTTSSRSEYKKNFKRFKKDGVIFGVHFNIKHKNGKIIATEFNGRVGHDDHGRFQQTHCIMHDITERVRAQKELEKSKQEFANLAAHLQSVRENERANVAREIHDELGQALTALKMDLSWTSTKISGSDKKVILKIKSMMKLIDSVLQTVKKISSELRPGILDDLGLSAAIEWQTDEFRSRTGLKCSLNIHPEEIVLPESISIAVFRIFQETLTNIVRHAKASSVKIALTKDDDMLRLKIKDDGKGIQKRQIFSSKSFGLIGIRERAQFLGGEVQFEGIRNKGTTVNLTIPIEA